MPFLRRQNLDFNQFRYYADWHDHDKGKKLYEQGSARVTDFTGQNATLLVTEKAQTYEVTIQAVRQTIQFGCTCQSHLPDIRLCYHIVAAVYALRDYLKHVAEKDWRYRLELALESVPPPSRVTRTFPAGIVFVGLEIGRQVQTHIYSAALRPCFLSVERWNIVQEIAASPNPTQATFDWLNCRDDWQPLAQYYLRGAPIQPVNLSFETQELFKLAVASPYEYGAYTRLVSYSPSYLNYYAPSIPFDHLPLLARLNVPIFLKQENRFTSLLRVHPQTIRLQVVLMEEKDAYELQTGIQLDDQIYPLARHKLRIFAETSSWALAGETLVQIENLQALPVLSMFPLKVPRAQAEELRRYFSRLSKHLPVVGETVKWEIVQDAPVPRLYLSQKGEQPLEAELRFGYGAYEFPARGLKPPREEIIEIPAQWGGIKVLRDAERERHYYTLLADARYGLKRASADRPSIFQIRARTHPFDFLIKCIPALTEAGFEIFGDKDIARINRHKPILSLSTSQNWRGQGSKFG